MSLSGGHRWLKLAAIVVAIEYIAALAIGMVAGFPFRLPIDTYILISLTFAALYGLGTLGIRLVRYARSGVESPLAAIKEDDWSGVVQFTNGALVIGLQLAVLMWTKTMMPLVNGFWADPFLADLDKAIFGVDPWVLTHAMPDWSSGVIDRLYATWAPLKMATIVAVLLAPATVLRGRLFLTYFLLMASVALGQYLAASAGPIFYERIGLGPRFADLPIEPWAQRASDYIWSDYLRGGGKVGGGISAMPSLHVGMAGWIALCLKSYFPKLAWVGWTYVLLIYIGSVHLGWHYATDGLVALLLLWGSWKLSKRLLPERQ